MTGPDHLEIDLPRWKIVDLVAMLAHYEGILADSPATWEDDDSLATREFTAHDVRDMITLIAGQAGDLGAQHALSQVLGITRDYRTVFLPEQAFTRSTPRPRPALSMPDGRINPTPTTQQG